MNVAFLAAAVALVVAAPSRDVVRLKNGGILKGTIAELVPGDFVSIVLVTGETRKVPMREVEYAGPDQEEPGGAREGAGAPASEGGVQVKLVGNVKDLTFFYPSAVSVGHDSGVGVGFGVGFGGGGSGGSLGISSGGGASRQVAFSRICIAPCTATFPRGAHRLAVAEADGDPVLIKDPVTIEGATTLEATYRSYWPVRLAGRVVSLGSLAAGVAVALSWGLSSSVQNDVEKSKDPTQPLIGGGIAIGGGILGLILSGIDDSATIRAAP